ncbi:MAG: putative ribosome biogenesis GTPase RsgA [Candidatus Sericytochromatia bacterium]|nr:MAG: putative ribosome biogenesis GTPase RsgA [Candidatus Sericytochromatia bacterium]
MLREKIKKASIIPKVGDIVEIEKTSNKTGVIIDVKPRKNELSKPNIANIDQVVIVLSSYKPDFNSLILDKFLVFYQSYNIDCIICINKSDLLDNSLKEFINYYSNIGYKLIYTSAKTGDGIDDLKQELLEKVSVLAGVSGAGKSSIINRIDSNLKLKVGDVSENLGIGKHTTRYVSLQMIRYKNKNCFIADSPGFSFIELNNIESKKLSYYFREFIPFINKCEMKDCLHLHEDNCFLKKNIDIENNHRYLNYLKFLNEILEIEKIKKTKSSKIENNIKIFKKSDGKNIKIIKLPEELRDKSRKFINQNLKKLEKINSIDDIDL